MGRRLPAAAAGLAAPPPALKVEAIEVTQAVQDLAHSIPLIADRRTAVRVYVSLANGSGPLPARGVIAVRVPQAPGVVRVPSFGATTLDPARGVDEQRRDASASLNFVLPPSVTGAGSIDLELEEAMVGTHRVTPDPASSSVTVQLVPGPALRVALVGVRYTQNGTAHEPSELDFALIESWLRRAYPARELIVSRRVVPASWSPPMTCNRVNAELSSIRAQDVSAGQDRRTHYYGVVSDGGGFMRGCASGIPASADPTVVASGPAGSADFGWDHDGSYADWYCGHELGHTFGRMHPGFCGQTSDDPAYPYAHGRIGDAQDDYVGFDLGDAALGLPMRAYPWKRWHDVMTYCDQQWLGPYTYREIQGRLMDEEKIAPAPAAAAGLAAGPGAQRLLHAVAEVDLTANTADFVSVHPVDAGTPNPAASSPLSIRVLDAGGQPLGSWPVEFRRSSCWEPGDDEVGLVDVLLAVDPGVRALELLHDGTVLATFGAVPGAGLAAPGGLPKRYTVQVSTDGGQTFLTLAVDLAAPALAIDPSPYASRADVVVRVLETDGFEASVTDHVVAVDDLPTFDGAP
ncbi:MAG: hypothetical protein RLP09_18650 [Sandaracinaceae bacterium]